MKLCFNPLCLRYSMPSLRLLLVVLSILNCLQGSTAATSQTSATTTSNDITEMPAFDVKGERFEDFGFRVSHDLDVVRSREIGRSIYTPVVDMVLPNTAASKAGIRPGDRVLKSDGISVANKTASMSKWRDIQHEKWAEISTGKSGVEWVLEVETAGTEELRTVKLQLPTPAPHWGSTVWRTPQDRIPVTVSEPGPLSERAEQVLNNGIWTLLRGSYVRGFKMPIDAAHPCFLCYQWTLWEGSVGHRMYVSQQRDRTDIILEAIYRQQSGLAGLFSFSKPTTTPEKNLTSATTVFAIDAMAYLTSPSGELHMAWTLARQDEVSREAAREGFEAEVNFWRTKVGKVSPLWPLEVINSSPGNAKK